MATNFFFLALKHTDRNLNLNWVSNIQNNSMGHLPAGLPLYNFWAPKNWIKYVLKVFMIDASKGHHKHFTGYITMVFQFWTSNKNISICRNVIFYNLIFSKCVKLLRPLSNGTCGLHKTLRPAVRQLISNAPKEFLSTSSIPFLVTMQY
jgi:hypothetical protein